MKSWEIIAALIVAIVLPLAIWRGAWLSVAFLVVLIIWWIWITRASWRPVLWRWWDEFRHPLHTANPVVRWNGPAKNPDHAGMRADYERLAAASATHTPGDRLTVAALLEGLSRYNDHPLAQPPTVRAQFMGSVGVGGLLGSAVGRYAAIGVGALMLMLVAACAMLWGRGEALKAQRDAPCSTHELSQDSSGGFHTTRAACATLGQAEAQLAALEVERNQQAAARAGDVANGVHEARETVSLNQRTRQREAARRDRQRRAHEDDLESVRNARAPNWDSRLRELGPPSAAVSDVDTGAGAGAGADPASRVPDERGGPADVPDPAAAGGAGGGSGSGNSQPASAHPIA